MDAAKIGGEKAGLSGFTQILAITARLRPGLQKSLHLGNKFTTHDNRKPLNVSRFKGMRIGARFP